MGLCPQEEDFKGRLEMDPLLDMRHEYTLNGAQGAKCIEKTSTEALGGVATSLKDIKEGPVPWPSVLVSSTLSVPHTEAQLNRIKR